MITNIFFIYNVWSVYWRIAKLPYVQVLMIISLTVASIDIVYRLMLLRWCLQKVVIGENVTTMSNINGIQNTEIPPQRVPVYFPSWCQRHLDDYVHVCVPIYEVLLIDRHRLRFLPPIQMFNPPNIIFICHQPRHNPHQYHLIGQNHNLVVVEEFITIHYVDGYGHINQLVE